MKLKRIVLILLLLSSVFACNDDDDVVIIEETGELNLQTVANTNANEAVWIPREAMKSRNGEAMGYGALLNPMSDKILIFLDGGGACFNGLTCAFNLDSFSEEDFYQRLSSENSLLLNRDNEANQFKDWNVIFVPYATGDVHVGSNANASIANGGPQNQTMVGATNFTIILNDLSTYFDTNAGLSEIVFAGSSAGGFGVLPNYFKLKETLGQNVPTTAIVDAGQIFMNADLLTSCLVENWENSWNISLSLPPDLDAVVQNNYEFDIQKVYEYSSLRYPEDNFGFLSYYEDGTNTFFYGFGQNDCNYPPSGPVSGVDFKEGLIDLQNSVLANLENWKVFYKTGTSHTFLGDSNLVQTVNGTSLNDWISELRQGIADDLME